MGRGRRSPEGPPGVPNARLATSGLFPLTAPLAPSVSTPDLAQPSPQGTASPEGQARVPLAMACDPKPIFHAAYSIYFAAMACSDFSNKTHVVRDRPAILQMRRLRPGIHCVCYPVQLEGKAETSLTHNPLGLCLGCLVTFSVDSKTDLLFW